MPFDQHLPIDKPLSIAVIGSGITGMAAAWLLSENHNISVFEKDDRIGGHTNTVIAKTHVGDIPVDTGFIVYNAPSYPNLVRLFKYLDVPTQESDMSFAVSLGNGALEYAGTNISSLFAQPSNAFRPRYWRMLKDLVRFYHNAPNTLVDVGIEDMTLGDYLAQHRYSEAFVDDHLLPMAAAIWSTAADNMRNHSAAGFIRFFQNHSLFNLTTRPAWRTVSGGSGTYAEILTRAYKDAIHVNAGVAKIMTSPDASPIIVDNHGNRQEFDRIIIATHADQALALLESPTETERDLLGRFKYAANRAILHSDVTQMPKRRKAWSSWNVVSESRRAGHEPVSLTYWMNRLQNLDDKAPLFVSLNPTRQPPDETIHAAFDYEHPIFTDKTQAARQDLWKLQGQRGLYYGGSYFGDGFHEDGLQSGLRAAELAGHVVRPWSSPDQNSRISINPKDRTPEPMLLPTSLTNAGAS